jgi:hypothetical protein
MDITGQLQALDALTPMKETSTPMNKRLGGFQGCS